MKLTPGAYIIAYDPGVTTGIAAARYTGGRYFELLESGEIKWEERFAAIKTQLYGYSEMASDEGVAFHIVSEEFMLYPNKSQSLAYDKFPSVKVQGIIETYLHELDLLDKLTYQKASERKAVEVLERDFPLVRGSDHRIDSYQHLRLYVLRNRIPDASPAR